MPRIDPDDLSDGDLSDSDLIAIDSRRHLPSGDWALVFQTQSDGEKAQKIEGWPARAFGVPAIAPGKSYTVVARGLHVPTVRQMGPQIAAKITKQNNVRAVAATLPRRVGKLPPDITKSTLYIAVETVQQADSLCDVSTA